MVFVFFTSLYFTLLYFTLFYFTLLCFTLLYFTLLIITFLVAVFQGVGVALKGDAFEEYRKNRSYTYNRPSKEKVWGVGRKGWRREEGERGGGECRL